MMNMLRILTAVLTGAAGGLLFHMLGLPMAWLLGPAFATMIVGTISPARLEWPRLMGDSGVVVVAYVLGGTMHLDIVMRIVHDLPMMMLSASLWILCCFVIGHLFARAARIGIATSVLGNMPGGLTQMVMIADDFKGADPGVVAIMQTTRVITVLYTVPFLAAWFDHHQASALSAIHTVSDSTVNGTVWPAYIGWLLIPAVPLAAWLFRRYRFPAGEFLGPVLFVGALSVAGCMWPTVPDEMLSAAQLLIGIYIGRRVNLRAIMSNRRLGPLALISSCVLVMITALAAWVIPAVLSGSYVTWFLALSPGGLGEVAVTAMLLEEDVAQVTAYQICRLLFVLLVAPQFIRWYLRRHHDHAASVES